MTHPPGGRRACRGPRAGPALQEDPGPRWRPWLATCATTSSRCRRAGGGGSATWNGARPLSGDVCLAPYAGEGEFLAASPAAALFVAAVVVAATLAAIPGFSHGPHFAAWATVDPVQQSQRRQDAPRICDPATAPPHGRSPPCAPRSESPRVSAAAISRAGRTAGSAHKQHVPQARLQLVLVPHALRAGRPAGDVVGNVGVARDQGGDGPGGAVPFAVANQASWWLDGAAFSGGGCLGRPGGVG